MKGFALLLVAVLALPARAQTVATASDSLPTVQLPPELDRVLRDYERLWRAGDAAALVMLFTEDGFVMQPNRPPVRGRAAMERVYRGQGGGALKLRALAFAKADTVGYIIGAYGYGDAPGDMGKFTLTLRRQRGGKWLIASDMDNGSRAPTPRPSPAAAATATATATATAPVVAPAEPEVRTYREVDGAALKAYVFMPSSPTPTGGAPAVILLHGGGWSAGSPDWVTASAQRYATLGMVGISIQYRLSDDRITPIDALADVCAALRWVRAEAKSLGVNATQVAANGTSAGGHLAASAATLGCGNTEGAYGNGGPDALILWSPALDVSNDGHFRRLLKDRAPVAAYSPVEHVRPRMPPTHVVIGDRDTLTPLSGAKRFCERVQAGGGVCELAVYPGVGHLLTRNLANQESDFDPDPTARADGIARQVAFAKALWKQ